MLSTLTKKFEQEVKDQIEARKLTTAQQKRQLRAKIKDKWCYPNMIAFGSLTLDEWKFGKYLE